MNFWLTLLTVVLVAVAARLLGLTEELRVLSNACVVVLAVVFVVDYVRRKRSRVHDRRD